MRRTIFVLACVFAWATWAAGGAGAVQEPAQETHEAFLPPAIVEVVPAGRSDARVAVPVEFTIPLPTADLADGVTHYLVATTGVMVACQTEPLDSPQAEPGYRWVKMTASAPVAAARYTLLTSHANLRPEIPLAGVVARHSETILQASGLRLLFDPARFTLFHAVQIGSRQAVGEYHEEIINIQQGVTVTLVDVFRQAEFTLLPRVEKGSLRIEREGPAVASVVYEGRFVGHKSVPEIPFEAHLSISAGGLVGVGITFDMDGVGGEAFRIEKVTLRLPLLLKGASRVSFGGAGEDLAGALSWKGRSTLDVAVDGSFRFQDVDGALISGKGPLSWIHYGDVTGGVAVLWGSRPPARFAVAEYDEDLLVIDAGVENGKEASIYFRFFDGANDTLALDSEAAALKAPPSVTVDPRYIKAVTKAR